MYFMGAWKQEFALAACPVRRSTDLKDKVKPQLPWQKTGKLGEVGEYLEITREEDLEESRTVPKSSRNSQKKPQQFLELSRNPQSGTSIGFGIAANAEVRLDMPRFGRKTA